MSNNRSWARLARRVREMSWDELRTRGHQEVAKRTDFALSSFGVNLVGDHDRSLPEFCGHFFFEPADVPTILCFLRQRLPDAVDRIINQAEQICDHRFDLLGYRDVDYGPHIDWHLDAVHRKRAPQRAWYKVPYLDFNQVGDSKITWELNRHQHLVTLAKAYRLTGRPQFALEVFRQWYDWQQQNPYPIGINWASSLEVAFRSLSWLWISHLLQGCAIVPIGFPSDLKRALMLSGRHIARFPSTYFSPNTHLLGEGVGLFFIGTLCPGITAEMWQRVGWQIILREAQRQVWPDGMHFEASTYYHTYALDFFLHARVLAGLNGISIPAEFDKTLEKMLDVVLHLSSTGPLPRLGDDDGGRVFDPSRILTEHMLDPLALGALLFNRDDFKIAAGDLKEETVWLSGAERAARFDSLCGKMDAPASFALKPSGIHVMGSSEPNAQQLVINAGPSEPGRQGHRHADLLSVQVTIGGRDVLIDPGTYAYVGQERERDHFRGTAAHNSVQVDGLSQGQPDGPFEWSFLPRSEVSRWTMGSTFDFFEASHSGYRRLPDPVEHQRSIFYLKPQFWLVRDVLSGATVHEIGVHWHFSEGSLTTAGDGFTFLGENQTRLGLMFASNDPWSHDTGMHWHSRAYGRKEPAPLLRSSIKAELPVELVTLLTPISTTDAELGIFEPFVVESHRASVCAYTYTPAASATRHLFVFATAPGGWSLGPWSSDARLLLSTFGHRGQTDGFVLCDGSYLAFYGKQVLAASECLKYAELFFDGDRPGFRCSNEGAVRISPLTEAENVSRPDALASV
jgi:hypothetical protein